MNKWLRRILIAAIVIGLTLAGLYEYTTHVGRGLLRSEAFFDNRPTSYWRAVIERDLQMDPDDYFGRKPLTWWAPYNICTHFLANPDGSAPLIENKNAVCVLHEITNDQDQKIAGFARDTLKHRQYLERPDVLCCPNENDLFRGTMILKHNVKDQGVSQFFK